MASQVIKRTKLHSSPFALDRYHFDLPIENEQYPLLTQNYPSGLHRQTHLHRHPEAEISFYPNDSGTMLMEEGEVRFAPGDMFLISGDTFHQPVFDKKQNSGLFVLYFHPDLFTSMPANWDELAAMMSPGVRGYCHLRGHTRARQLVREAHETFHKKTTKWEIVCQGILLHLLAYFAKESSERMLRQISSKELKDIQSVRRVQKYIKNNLNAKIIVDDLCVIAECSRSQFYEKFKRIAGYSVNVWMQTVRLDRAQQLLRNSSMAITEVCYSCGYNCPSYFNRVFRRETGMTPTQYRLTK